MFKKHLLQKQYEELKLQIYPLLEKELGRGGLFSDKNKAIELGIQYANLLQKELKIDHTKDLIPPKEKRESISPVYLTQSVCPYSGRLVQLRWEESEEQPEALLAELALLRQRVQLDTVQQS